MNMKNFLSWLRLPSFEVCSNVSPKKISMIMDTLSSMSSEELADFVEEYKLVLQRSRRLDSSGAAIIESGNLVIETGRAMVENGNRIIANGESMIANGEAIRAASDVEFQLSKMFDDCASDIEGQCPYKVEAKLAESSMEESVSDGPASDESLKKPRSARRSRKSNVSPGGRKGPKRGNGDGGGDEGV